MGKFSFKSKLNFYSIKAKQKIFLIWMCGDRAREDRLPSGMAHYFYFKIVLHISFWKKDEFSI